MRYQLDDPTLQTALDDLAARDTADWPAPDEQQRAILARILPAAPATKPAPRVPRTSQPRRNAA
ncbi:MULTISPECIES: hypothetical protein [unclassified Micromonospora]|uniref:hypothetical protein n=1 Tax=unclassified Micromonospora TaxID=2617518 RepID=UPI0033194FC7